MRLSLMGIGLPKVAQKPSPIPLGTMPDEIIEHILSFCAQPELLAVSATCSRLSSVANASLYRHVKPIGSTKAICFFRTICLREDLGAVVRKCEMELSLGCRPPVSPKERNPLLEIEIEFSKHARRQLAKSTADGSLAIAAAALRKMPNLTRLELIFPEKEVQTDYNALLLRGCPFQLRHFHTNLRFDICMAKFLRGQMDLRDLRFHSSAPCSALDMTILDENTLPLLNSLGWSHRVPIELVRHLVRGRPIDTVNIHLPADVKDISDFLAIGLEASPLVRTANLTFRDHRYPMYSQLEVANMHFPNLTGLGVAMPALTQDIINDLYKSVKYFKNLERLFIYDQFHELPVTRPMIIQYAQAFWNRCATLRKIGFYACDPFLMVEKTITDTGRTKTVLWVVQS